MKAEKYWIRKFSCGIRSVFFLIVLFFSSIAHSEIKEDNLWFPDSVTAEVVSPGMMINGVSMKIWEIRSDKSVSELMAYYKKLWSAEPGFLQYPANGWQVSGFVKEKWFVSIQLLEGQLDSFGYLTISTYPERTPGQLNTKLITLPADSKTMVDISAVDGPHKSRTITFSNKQSLKSNVDFFRKSFQSRGWAEDRGLGDNPSVTTLLFRNGPDNATIALNKIGSDSAGVAIVVEH